MTLLPKLINKTLSTRLSLMVVSAMAVLLMVSLAVMLHYSRKAVKEEALQKASQALDGTVQSIDNILLNIEQTAGNYYVSMLPYIHEPEKMHTYCRKRVEGNPRVSGCAIAFTPGFYHDGQPFMAYYHRVVTEGLPINEWPVVQSETFAGTPYTDQLWYTYPMKTAVPGWMNPLGDQPQAVTAHRDSGQDPTITFSLPIMGADWQPVGVMGVDVSLHLLSTIILSVKLSDGSYCTLLDSLGSYIVHPNGDKLIQQTVFAMDGHSADASVKEAAEAMISGQTGYKPFRMDDTDYYIFYKPFTRAAIPGRSLEKLGWSAGIIYPKDDIFGDYNSLARYVIAIAVIGLLLLLFLSRFIIHRHLKPLVLLTESAQRIAKGDYDATIPASWKDDEIGRLQTNFKKMQQSLATHIGELEHLTATLEERNKALRKAYSDAQMADRMKTAFLHNMTNQMVHPAETISNDVDLLCNEPDTANRSLLADNIQTNGKTITELLNNLIRMSDENLAAERLEAGYGEGHQEKGGGA